MSTKRETIQMRKNRLTLPVFSIVVVLAVTLSGCAPVRALTKGKTAPPEQVVSDFYDWYLSYPGSAIGEGAHRSSEYLTEELVEKVDTLVASFDQGGYDPLLCAQDIPGDLIVDEAVVSGDEASVVVHQIWNVGTEHEFEREVVVELQTVGGVWSIADIICR
jgi:uncharacterized protein YceK